jgi:dipeptidyl aminopeptidase/acylaminoacyl peptidase
MFLRLTLALTTTLALLVTQSARAADARVPLASFVQDEQFSRPRLSPDGEHVAIIVKLAQGDRFIPTVTVYSLPDLKIVSAVRLPAFQVPLDMAWTSNSRLAIAKGIEVGTRERPQSTGEILAVDMDGARPEYLYGYHMFSESSRGDRIADDHGGATFAALPHPRNNHLLINAHEWNTERSHLYDINALNASRKALADINMPYLKFVMQPDMTPRYAYGSDEKNHFVLYRRDDTSGAWTLQPQEPGEQLVPRVFSADGLAVYGTWNKNGGPDKVVRQDVASGARVTLASHNKSNVDLIMENALGVPFAAGSELGIPHLSYFDPQDPDTKLHQALSAQFPGAFVSFINYSDNGSKLLFGVTSDRDPGSYYLYDKQTNNAALLFATMQQIDPDQMAERRPVHYTARDGLDLYGYLTLPKHAAGVKLPMVLLPHGGPHGIRDTWFYDNDAQFLASRGYAVLQVNYRGSIGRGARFQLAGYRHWGDAIQDDLIDGVKWAVSQGEVDGGRVCVFGASFGAYSALMLPARAPGMFKCAVGYAGVYDLPLLYKRDDVGGEARLQNSLGSYIGTDQAEMAKFSPDRLADKITVPVLLVHGGKDKVAPIEHAYLMRDALTKAGHAPEWMEVPYEGHGFYDSKNVSAFYGKLEAFLQKNIGQ